MKCPKCKIYMELIERFNALLGAYSIWRCPKCTREEESQ